MYFSTSSSAIRVLVTTMCFVYSLAAGGSHTLADSITLNERSTEGNNVYGECSSAGVKPSGTGLKRLRGVWQHLLLPVSCTTAAVSAHRYAIICLYSCIKRIDISARACYNCNCAISSARRCVLQSDTVDATFCSILTSANSVFIDWPPGAKHKYHSKFTSSIWRHLSLNKQCY